MDIYNKPLLLTATEFDCLRIDDCACPESPFTIKTQRPKNNLHTRRTDNLHIKLSDKFHLLFSPYSPVSPSVVNNIAYQRYQQFQKPQPLSQEIDYQLSEQNLITPTESQPTIQNNPIEQLTAWLHITNACNLDCPYCYVKKSSASMDETIAKNSIDQLFQTAKSQGFKTIKLKYAGGEAILHFKLIKTIHEYASQLAEQTGIKLQEVILTNGTLINAEIAQWLADTKIKLMISIDGLNEIHDQQRYTKQGKPSFQQIEHNINHYLLPAHVKPTICVTVTKNNALYMAELMQWILQHGFHFTLNFYRENNLSANHSELKLEEQTIIQGLLTAYKIIEQNLPDYSLLNGLLDKTQTIAHTHTCGVNKNYLVITHEGKISQCQMHVDQPVSSLLNDNIFIQLQSAPIKNLSVDEKEGCKDCTFRYRCTGGCPLETHRATGRWDIKSPHCHIYQTLYPEILRLEGLRLLKYHA